MKIRLSIYEKFFLAAIPVLLVLAMYAFRPPRYPLLDAALKGEASNPRALAEVLRWFEDSPPTAFHGNHILFDVQHQALPRLLDLQWPVFRQRISPANEKCAGADSPRILPLNASGATFQIIGTPSLDPDYHETEGGYYSMEVFTFAEEGAACLTPLRDGAGLGTVRQMAGESAKRAASVSGDRLQIVAAVIL